MSVRGTAAIRPHRVRVVTGAASRAGLVVAPGYTDPLKFADGNPYGVSHVTGGNNDTPLGDAQYAALDHMAQRVVFVADKLNA